MGHSSRARWISQLVWLLGCAGVGEDGELYAEHQIPDDEKGPKLA